VSEPTTPFQIIYAPITKAHLRSIERTYYSLIRDTIAEQLTHMPLFETRNRKPLKRPVFFQATWELRFGPGNRFRVYYDVDLAQRQVSILAIGSKDGATLSIGGEEYLL
jgi:mRNA-degrading endonuclease RelE of RelBE toxin-antitoxin system